MLHFIWFHTVCKPTRLEVALMKAYDLEFRGIGMGIFEYYMLYLI